jgi:hypothetical protein
MIIVQAYQTSQHVVPRGAIFLGKWRSFFARSSESKMNAQSDCVLNTYLYYPVTYADKHKIKMSLQIQPI